MNKDVEDMEEAFRLVGELDDDDEGPPDPKRRRRVVAACSCVLGNETAERLAYYGLQTNMSLYAKQFLGYPAARATSLLQAWKATVYLTPLLGAFLADAYLGRFAVILIFSTLYLAGLSGVTAVNVAPSLRPRLNQPPAGGSYGPTRGAFWAFMYLIALGSGGIKACVSSFGGDQFREDSARERAWRSSFFNWFYFCINVGSLIATLVVVPVQESHGYAIGFAIPTALMGAAILVFLLGAALRVYTYVPPEGSPLRRIWGVAAGAVRNRKLPAPEGPEELYEPAPGEGRLKFRMAHTDRFRRLDKAAIPAAPAGTDDASEAARAPRQVSMTEVEETKALLGLVPIFLCVCIWQMAYDPVFTLLPLPGDAMDRRMGPYRIPASSISFANTFGVLVSVAAWDLAVAPMARRRGRPISTTARIGYGYIVAFVALMSAGLIEVARYRVVRTSGLLQRWEAAVAADPKADYSAPEFTQPMSIWWQAIPYFLLGASETLTNVGVMELFFTEVSEGTRALGSSINLLTTAVGTYLAGALNTAVAAATARDPWVADNPLYGRYDLYFFVNAGILALGYVAFLLVARNYKAKPHPHAHAPAHAKGKGRKSGLELTATIADPPAAGAGAGELRSRWRGGDGATPRGVDANALQARALDPL